MRTTIKFKAYGVMHRDGSLHGGKIPCMWRKKHEAIADCYATIGGRVVELSCEAKMTKILAVPNQNPITI